MRGIRTFIAAAAVAGLVAGFAPTQSQAAESATVVFSLGANVGDKVYAPGLGDGVETTFAFGYNNQGIPRGTGIGGTNSCVGVHSTAGVDADCQLGASGTFGKGLGGQGAYCGYSSGDGDVDRVRIGGQNVKPKGLKVSWPNSAGTVIPLVYTIGGSPAGIGAVQTTGAAPGTCGVGDGTNSFAVTGFSVLAAL